MFQYVLRHTAILLICLGGLGHLGCDETEKIDNEGAMEAIVDGRVDIEGRYPHVVLVGQGCTGTLVTPVHVLTAAHCLCEKQETPSGGWIKDGSYCQNEVRVTFESQPNQFDGQVRGYVTTHPMFVLEADADNKILRAVADLAIINLAECAPQSVAPVPLMTASPRLPDNGVALGRIVGFGKTSCDATSRAVDRWWGDAFVTSVATEFLEISSRVSLGGEEISGAVSWSGDSGGPLLMDQDEGEWRVAGVLSKATCGQESGDTAWYTNMHSYRDWYDGLVDPAMAAMCYEEEVVTEPPTIESATGDYDIESDELILAADVTDLSSEGLSHVEIRVAPLVDSECAPIVADVDPVDTVSASEGQGMSWRFERRVEQVIGAGMTVCVSLIAEDATGKRSDPAIFRVSRCRDDCNGHGSCDFSLGECGCEQQYSGDSCATCTPNCDSLQCGDDGCGGVCGVCEAPPARTCRIDTHNGRTETGEMIFGAGAQSTLITHGMEGRCAEGMCAYDSETTACPEHLGYADESGDDYGCLDGRCLAACETIERRAQDFSDTFGGQPAPPYGYDWVYVGGVPSEVDFFCAEAGMDGECAGMVIYEQDVPIYACGDTISVRFQGRIRTRCGATVRPPATLSAMMICQRPSAGGRVGNMADEQLPYECPAEQVTYAPNTGFFDIDCAPPFPTDSCDGRLSFFLRYTLLDGSGPYIKDVTSPSISNCGILGG